MESAREAPNLILAIAHSIIRYLEMSLSDNAQAVLSSTFRALSRALQARPGLARASLPRHLGDALLDNPVWLLDQHLVSPN